jgi:hypothetical protein
LQLADRQNLRIFLKRTKDFVIAADHNPQVIRG